MSRLPKSMVTNRRSARRARPRSALLSDPAPASDRLAAAGGADSPDEVQTHQAAGAAGAELGGVDRKPGGIVTTLNIAPMLKPIDVAEALVISERQVRRMAARGQIPGAVLVGKGRWRFRFNEIRAFIEGKGAALAGGR